MFKLKITIKAICENWLQVFLPFVFAEYTRANKCTPFSYIYIMLCILRSIIFKIYF